MTSVLVYLLTYTLSTVRTQTLTSLICTNCRMTKVDELGLYNFIDEAFSVKHGQGMCVAI